MAARSNVGRGACCNPQDGQAPANLAKTNPLPVSAGTLQRGKHCTQTAQPVALRCAMNRVTGRIMVHPWGRRRATSMRVVMMDISVVRCWIIKTVHRERS